MTGPRKLGTRHELYRLGYLAAILLLLFSHVFISRTYADDQDVVVVQDGELKNVPVKVEDVKVGSEFTYNLSPEDYEEPPGWGPEMQAALEDAKKMAPIMRRESDKLWGRLGDKRFFELVDTDKVKMNAGEWGRMEVTLCDGVPIVRVVHAKTKLSFLFYDKWKIRRDSAHLRQIISSQHIKSGDDWHGWKFGRNTVLVATDEGGKVLDFEYLPKNTIGTADWFKDYWFAHYGEPSKGDTVLASLSAVAQGGIALGISSYHLYNEPEKGFDGWTPGFSSIFAYVLGKWNRTQRSMFSSGPEFSKYLKQMGLSLFFGYAVKGTKYTVAVIHNQVAEIVNFIEPAKLPTMDHTTIFITAILHNLGRKAWYSIPEAISSERDMLGTWRVFGANIKKNAIIFQGCYLVPFTIKTLGFVGLGKTAFGVELPYVGHYNVDWGTILQLGTIPVAHFIGMSIAEARGYKSAQKIRDHWDKTWGRVFYVPSTIFQGAYSMLRDAAFNVRYGCKSYLARSGQGAELDSLAIEHE